MSGGWTRARINLTRDGRGDRPRADELIGATPCPTCGRFCLYVPPDALAARYDAELAYDYEPRYNVAPCGPGIAAVRDDDQDVFSVADVWETWTGHGEAVHTAAIVTTGANHGGAPSHDRMPVILARGEEERWLDSDDPDELHSALDPYPASLTDAYEVSTAVNDPANDGPRLVEPVGGEHSSLGGSG